MQPDQSFNNSSLNYEDFVDQMTPSQVRGESAHTSNPSAYENMYSQIDQVNSLNP